MWHKLLGIQFVFVFCLLLFLGGCKPRIKNANLKSLAINTNAKNIALVVASSGTGSKTLSGLDYDIDRYRQIFDQSSGFQLEIIQNKSADDVLTKILNTSKNVDTNGTFALIYAGHGLKDGSWDIDDQRVPFSYVATTLVRARSQKPFKRLIVISDSCYAGQLVNGKQDVSEFNLTNIGNIPTSAGDFFVVSASQNCNEGEDYCDPSPEEEDALGNTVGQIVTALSAVDASDEEENPGKTTYSLSKQRPRIYESALIIAASNPAQTALTGTGGGLFSARLFDNYQRLKYENPNVTIKQWLDDTVTAVHEYAVSVKDSIKDGKFKGQTPAFAAYPPDLLNEPVFVTSSSLPSEPFTSTETLTATETGTQTTTEEKDLYVSEETPALKIEQSRIRFFLRVTLNDSQTAKEFFTRMNQNSHDPSNERQIMISTEWPDKQELSFTCRQNNGEAESHSCVLEVLGPLKNIRQKERPFKVKVSTTRSEYYVVRNDNYDTTVFKPLVESFRRSVSLSGYKPSFRHPDANVWVPAGNEFYVPEGEAPLQLFCRANSRANKYFCLFLVKRS